MLYKISDLRLYLSASVGAPPNEPPAALITISDQPFVSKRCWYMTSLLLFRLPSCVSGCAPRRSLARQVRLLAVEGIQRVSMGGFSG